MNKRILLIILAIVAIAGTAGYYYYNKPAEKSVSADASASVSAVNLMAEFEADETSANNKYLNKVIEVTGVVGEVSKDDLFVTIAMDTENPMASVTCSIDKESYQKEITSGSTIKVKGLCTGLLMDVVLTKCSIVE